MATTFKNFLNSDRTTARTLLHEAIPLTGTIVSGTYGAFHSENNIKNYSHGMFQSVYDYPYLSASANHVFDITVGYSSDSKLSASTSNQNDKKINIYTEFAQVLAGHDATGSVFRFDPSGSNVSTGTKINEAIFLNFARLLTKDEIKKGSFSLKLGVSGTYGTGTHTEMSDLLTITDKDAATSYFVNSPAGEYAILYATGSTTPLNREVGLLYYQAGVAVITGACFMGGAIDGYALSSTVQMGGTGSTLVDSMESIFTSSLISQSCDSVRHRIYDVSFDNTTELNSTIYFCRVNHNEFNYSSNPSYLTGSKIRVKGHDPTTPPLAYITGIGLYSADRELMASAKLSEPLKKDPTNEYTLRVRLDY